MKCLPDNLILKKPHGVESKDIDEVNPIIISPSRKGWVNTTTSSGNLKISTEKDLATLLKTAKRNVTYCMPEEFFCILKVLTENQLFRLDRIGRTPFHQGYLYKYKNGVRYEEGGKHYFFDNIVGGFLNHNNLKGLNTRNLDDIHTLASVIVGDNIINGIPNYSLNSSASNARAFILNFEEIRNELWQIFNWYHKYRDLIDKFYGTCINPPQLSIGIGTDNLESWDMVRSYLSILRYTPSILNCRVFKNMPYTEKATHSISLIEGNIPPNRYQISPLPSTLEEEVTNSDYVLVPILSRKIVHRDGPFKGWFPKPYIDLLRYLKIPFKTHKSYQLIPTGDVSYSYRRFCDEVEALIEKGKNSLVNKKYLYQTTVGSKLFIYDCMDEKTGELYYEAGATFDPIGASHVYATQWCYVWWQNYVNEGYVRAIRSDALTATRLDPAVCPFIPNSEHFHITKRAEGLHTFLTPYLKKFPDGKGLIWLEMIRHFRDHPRVLLEYQTRRQLSETMYDPRYLGRELTLHKSIAPSYGNARTGPEISKLGMLEDKWFKSTPESSTIDSELRDYNWLADYLEVSGQPGVKL